MIFVSKLETWGMPLIEYKATNKPIIVSDLPYAYETIDTYKNVCFVNPDDSKKIAINMEKIIKGEKFDNNSLIEIDEPYAKDWHELLTIIFNED